MNIVQQAKVFAIKAHGQQKYGKLPYEYHLQQVVSKLTLWRGMGQWEITDECLAIAWLHDVIEDTDYCEEDVAVVFGKEVAYQVLLLSKLGGLSYGDYIYHIRQSCTAKLVKMSDTLCNLEASILSGEMKRINKYSKQLSLLTEV